MSALEESYEPLLGKGNKKNKKKQYTHATGAAADNATGAAADNAAVFSSPVAANDPPESTTMLPPVPSRPSRSPVQRTN